MPTRADRRALPDVQYRPLVVVLIAVCAGVVADRYTAIALHWWWLGGVTAWAVWWVLWRERRQRLAVWPLLIAVAASGAAWHHCRWSLFSPDQAVLSAQQDGGPAAIRARVVAGPFRVPAPPFDPLQLFALPDRTRLEVEVTSVRDDATWRAASGRTTVLVSGHLGGVRPGDWVRIFGQMAPVRPPANPGEFDFAQQARCDRRLCWVTAGFPECVTLIERGSRFDGRRMLGSLRGAGDALLWRNLLPNRSPLAAAMFLGMREELEPGEVQAFRETGTIHLLVVSGLHVGILATFLMLAMRAAMVPRRAALVCVAVAVLLYAAATSGHPPVVRAAVMVLIACAAIGLGRRAVGYNAIAAAALVVLALSPGELFQPGTQLSFLCVVGLAWLAQRQAQPSEVDPLASLIARTRPWPVRAARGVVRSGWRLVLVSFVIWVFICPLVMSRFHLFSPIAVALGPLLSLPMVAAMASGFGLLLFGWVIPPVGGALGSMCDASLGAMQYCIAAARDVPGNHAWVAGPADWWLVGFYAALLVWVLVPRIAPPRRWCLALAAGWIGAGFAVSFAAERGSDELACTFLSVGHGEAVVVELPGGKTLLYDAGRLGTPTRASRAVSGYLWSRGVTHLDAIVISHADADHYNAVPEILEQFSVGVVYVSPMMFEQRSPALDALQAALTEANVPVREITSADALQTGSSATIDVLHPTRVGVLGSDNANSIVLSIGYAGRRILLTGDLESPGLEEVTSDEPQACDVLLAPHHGSASSDPPGFAAWSTPRWTVISGGQREPADQVVTAYSEFGEVRHTATHGAVRAVVGRGGVTVACWRDAHW